MPDRSVVPAVVPTVVGARNARFQQWQALLTNRSKRNHAREFVVQGVRPISTALELGFGLRAVLRPRGGTLSDWARQAVRRTEDAGVDQYALAPDLLAELGERDEGAPELVAIAVQPADDLRRLEPSASSGSSASGAVERAPLVVAFDRPSAPGNIGSLLRAADAFGATGFVVTGHAADPYDPRAVRASTGSLFAVPVVRLGAAREAIAWARGTGLTIVGTDETGSAELEAYDFTGPTLLVIGNETRGMSAAWREACAAVVRIPLEPGTTASSLNAAAAGAITLYEAARSRRRT